jgi:hypothetical protein
MHAKAVRDGLMKQDGRRRELAEFLAQGGE